MKDHFYPEEFKEREINRLLDKQAQSNKSVLSLSNDLDLSFLQTVSRKVFNPLGIDLYVTIDEKTGKEILSGVSGHNDSHADAECKANSARKMVLEKLEGWLKQSVAYDGRRG
jgi:hypothetical protein